MNSVNKKEFGKQKYGVVIVQQLYNTIFDNQNQLK